MSIESLAEMSDAVFLQEKTAWMDYMHALFSCESFVRVKTICIQHGE